MTNDGEKSIKISLSIEVPIGGSPPKVSLVKTAPLLVSNGNVITVPTANVSNPARVNMGNAICVQGQAVDANDKPAVAVCAKIYTVADAPNPLPSTPQSPNTPASSIDLNGNYQMNAVPLPSSTSPTNYVVVTWATLGAYPYPILPASVTFAASSPGPYTDCSYPNALSLLQTASKSMSTADMDLVPVAWTLNSTGFSGGAVQLFNGERQLNLVKSAGQTILYCNGGNGTTTPQVQLRCSQPGTTDWELSFALGQKRVIYRQSSMSLEGAKRKLFQSPVAAGFNEGDGMPAIVSILPA